MSEARNLLARVSTALPVLRTMLDKEGLGGVDIADQMKRDIDEFLLKSTSNESAVDLAYRAAVADLMHLVRLNLDKFDLRDRETTARLLHTLQGKRRLFLHIKTSGVYEYMGEATFEGNLAEQVIYRNVVDGRVWVRMKSEFFDGRFRELGAP